MRRSLRNSFGGIPAAGSKASIRLPYSRTQVRPTILNMSTDVVSGDFLSRRGGGIRHRRKDRKGRGFVALGRGFLPI